VLATLCLASFMATLDLFVVNVALKDIGQDFPGQGLSNLSWVLNGYAIIFGALLIPAGRLADKYGRRNAFVAGLVIFTVASLACALAPDLWALVAFRCLQAVGAAVLTPASLGLVLTALPASKVVSGVRLWAVSAALAGAAGPVVGGLLTDLSGTGSAINATARQIGAVLATAVTVVILGQSATTGAAARFYVTWWVIVIGSAVGAIVVLGITPSRRPHPDPRASNSPRKAAIS
jgi:MFS family permease